MSILDKIKQSKKDGKPITITDPSELIVNVPHGRTAIAFLFNGPYQDTNMKTSRYMGPQRSEPARLLKPLNFVLREGPKGGITYKGTYEVGETIRIMGWPGVSDKKCCDLIVLRGDADLNIGAGAYQDMMDRVIYCKEGAYINLQEGVDYEYTGKAPMSAEKTKKEVIAVRDIEYVDELFCDGTLYAMTSLHLCTQFGETFLEYEGTRIMDDPVEGDDYI